MIRTLKNFAHLGLAITANLCYFFPSRSMKVIGVTGTDGKTTTASLIYKILTDSGKKVALLTTVSAIINEKSYDTGFHVTTPNPFMLQKILSQAKKSGVEYFILETTSHGLDQNRVWGIKYAVSVITNIADEHLDYHKTYEKYLEAKAKIIDMSNTIVLNKDDRSFSRLSNRSNKITYGMHKDADINPHKYPLKSSLPGEFNLYNSLAALGVCMQLGIDYANAKKAIESYKAPIGRQDIIQKTPFTIMVDFAHTPHSFHALLSSLRKEYSGKIIHVFGSAGERDQGKRAEMGKISSQFTDVIILTSEDPRSEKVENIIDQIATGISNNFTVKDSDTRQAEGKQVQSKNSKDNKYVYKIPDRREAIKLALSVAEKGDIVVVTGKGHEQSMNLGNGEIPWSDYEVINSILKKYEK